ncbi:MAG: hypothetical protein IKH11_03155 [Bacteroidales bacterium]|nr:hypothetical protein [Bacteroidales bacterium]
MRVKYLFAALAALFLSGSFLFAQTPEEIVERMIAEMDRGSAEGFSMDFNMKIPIVGTVCSHNMVLGDKMKTQITGKDKSSTSWSDATTKWTYDNRTGEITIENKASSSSDNSDTKAFDNIADGYKLTLKKETADAWYIVCNKLKSNKNKDDAKKMELTVSKATYLPICLRAKASLFTFSIENYALGVTEESVTFDSAAYPNATIVDKR